MTEADRVTHSAGFQGTAPEQGQLCKNKAPLPRCGAPSTERRDQGHGAMARSGSEPSPRDPPAVPPRGQPQRTDRPPLCPVIRPAPVRWAWPPGRHRVSIMRAVRSSSDSACLGMEQQLKLAPVTRGARVQLLLHYGFTGERQTVHRSLPSCLRRKVVFLSPERVPGEFCFITNTRRGF